MQTVPGDTVTMRTQVLIAPRRTVATHDVDLGAWPSQLGSEIVEQIKDPGIVVAYVSGAMVTQVRIQLGES
jgi:hypothetical protein